MLEKKLLIISRCIKMYYFSIRNVNHDFIQDCIQSFVISFFVKVKLFSLVSCVWVTFVDLFVMKWWLINHLMPSNKQIDASSLYKIFLEVFSTYLIFIGLINENEKANEQKIMIIRYLDFLFVLFFSCL